MVFKKRKTNKQPKIVYGGICCVKSCDELAASRNAFLCKNHGKDYAAATRGSTDSNHVKKLQTEWLLKHAN